LSRDQSKFADISVASGQFGESPQITQLFSTHTNIDDQSLSFQDLMKTLPMCPIAVVSTESQTDEQADQIDCNQHQLVCL
jgi:hypothetical protein